MNLKGRFVNIKGLGCLYYIVKHINGIVTLVNAEDVNNKLTQRPTFNRFVSDVILINNGLYYVHDMLKAGQNNENL